MGEKGTPRLTADEIVKVLKRHGFVRVSQSGSHEKWRNAETGKQVIVARHSGRVLPLGTMRAIIAGSGIEPEEWIDK